jgi:hypothetical protein
MSAHTTAMSNDATTKRKVQMTLAAAQKQTALTELRIHRLLLRVRQDRAVQ